MIDADIRHFLRRLNGGADGTFRLVHHRDLAEPHPARPGCRSTDHAELRLPRHWPDAVLFAQPRLTVKAQDQAGNL